MSHNITHNNPSKQCCCDTGTILPSELDKKIEEYERLIEETTVARDRFIQQELNLEGVAHEDNATANKNEILAAIASHSVTINPITTEQINALFTSES